MYFSGSCYMCSNLRYLELEGFQGYFCTVTCKRCFFKVFSAICEKYQEEYEE